MSTEPPHSSEHDLRTFLTVVDGFGEQSCAQLQRDVSEVNGTAALFPVGILRLTESR
jgi:hypothetical protein